MRRKVYISSFISRIAAMASRVQIFQGHPFEIISSTQWLTRYSVSNQSKPLFQKFRVLYRQFKLRVYTGENATDDTYIPIQTLRDDKIHPAATGGKFDGQNEIYFLVNASSSVVNLKTCSDTVVAIDPGEPIAFVSAALLRVSPNYAHTPPEKFQNIIYISEIMKYPDLKGAAAQTLYEFLYGSSGPWKNMLVCLEVDMSHKDVAKLRELYMRRGLIPSHLLYNPSFLQRFPRMKEIGDFYMNSFKAQNMFFPAFNKEEKRIFIDWRDDPRTTTHMFVYFPEISNHLEVIEADRVFDPTLLSVHPVGPDVMQAGGRVVQPNTTSVFIDEAQMVPSSSNGTLKNIIAPILGLFSGSQRLSTGEQGAGISPVTPGAGNRMIDDDDVAKQGQRSGRPRNSSAGRPVTHDAGNRMIDDDDAVPQPIAYQDVKYFADNTPASLRIERLQRKNRDLHQSLTSEETKFDSIYRKTYNLLKNNMDKPWRVSVCKCNQKGNGDSEPIQYKIFIAGVSDTNFFRLEKFIDDAIVLQRKLLLTVAAYHVLQSWDLFFSGASPTYRLRTFNNMKTLYHNKSQWSHFIIASENHAFRLRGKDPPSIIL